MPSIFQRLFKVGQSEAHSLVDQFEDPIKMTEQGIRDLKTNLQEAIANLAQVKSVAIRLDKDAEAQRQRAADYERKAMLLLQRMQKGELEAAEAERLATAALERKQEAAERAQTIAADHQAQEKMAATLQAKVEDLKRQIDRYENELVTLRARARSAESMKKINKAMAGVDASSTVALLERMKDKVTEEESLAQAYGELGEVGGDVDRELEEALEGAGSSKAAESLAALKAKMGIEA